VPLYKGLKEHIFSGGRKTKNVKKIGHNFFDFKAIDLAERPLSLLSFNLFQIELAVVKVIKPSKLSLYY
jgi:hypothetical protein